MVRKEKYIGLGIDQDTAPDKRKPDTYWDAENIQIVNNGRSLSIKPILGETEILTFPYIRSDQVFIVGYTVFMDNIYVFVSTGADCEIHRIDSTNTRTLMAFGTWYLSTDVRLDIIANYENENIIKLYWIDGIHPLRSINVSSVIGSISPDLLNNLGVIDFRSPIVEVLGGGSLVAGTIQYVYSMYRFNSSQSNLSPASELVSISNYFQGYDSQEITGLKTKVTIVADGNFDALKVYSIHYQELNQTPKISLIYDEVVTSGTVIIYDDGLSQIAELSLTDLLSIDYSPIIANTIATKRERLLVGNYKSENFNPIVDIRAYSYPQSLETTYLTNQGATELYYKTDLDTLSPNHDAINPNYDTYKYQYNSSTLGGTGVNIKYTFVTEDAVDGVELPKSLKQGEIYRLGLVFYNNYGQASPVNWMTDIKVPYDLGYDVNAYGVQVTLLNTSAFTSQGIVSYQLSIVERSIEDRTIISQGFIVPCVKYDEGTGGIKPSAPYYYPNYITKDILTVHTGEGGDIEQSYVANVDYQEPNFNSYPVKKDSLSCFYSTDTVFEDNITLNPTHIRYLGSAVCSDKTLSGARSLKMWYDEKLSWWLFQDEYATDWTPASGFPGHIMDQSSKTVDGTIYVFEVVTNKNYPERHIIPSIADKAIESATFIPKGGTKIITASETVSNTIFVQDLIKYGPSYLATSYNAVFAGCMLLNFDSETWHQTTIPYDKFKIDDSWATYRRELPLVELIATLPNQYGGNTHEAKQRNEYLKLGAVRPIDTTPNSEFIGDIWLAPLSINRCEGNDSKINGVMNIVEYIHLPWIENNHNVYARNDNMNTWKFNLSDTQTNYNFYRIADNHKLLGAYNQVPNLFKGYPIPFNVTQYTENPVSILGSNAKNPNEVLDSWLSFNPNNTKLLEGQYGTLTKLHNLAGDIVAIQSTGIAVVEIEPRVQTTDTDGLALQVGIGSLFYNHKYLFTNTGSSRKFTITDDGKNLYYYDDTLNLICSLHEGKLSTLKTIKNLLDTYTDGPLSSTYFNKQDQVYFQFEEFTLVYDILLQKFISRNTFLNSNKWLIPRGLKLYQVDDSTAQTVLYTQLTGTPKDNKVIYLMCPESIYDKVFHNLEYRLKGSNFTTIKVSNDISQSATVTPDLKTKFDIHRVHLPRVNNSRERFRGIYILVELGNTTGIDYALDDMVLMYNIKG